MKNTYEQLLKTQGVLYTTTVGVSMRPLLRDGKYVIEIRPAEDGYRRFDAVLFRRNGVTGRGAYVCHRILKVLPNGRYWIVGDNCTAGETVEEGDILGRMTGLRRGGQDGYLKTFAYALYCLFWVRPYHLRIALLRLASFVRRVRRFVMRRVRRILNRS